MSYTYTSLVAALASAMLKQKTDPNFLILVPSIIDTAEQRCYRDLDLVATIVRDTSGSLTANSRNFTLPQSLGRFVTVKGMNLGTTPRQQLRPVSIHYLDAVWPSETSASTPSYPKYFAFVTDQQYIVGPAPDSGYAMEVIGTIRPAPLSSSNTTTFLTNYLSDLYFAACMYAAGDLLKDAPDGAVVIQVWEQQYAARLASANKEETRRKYQSGDWTSETRPSPMPTSTPVAV